MNARRDSDLAWMAALDVMAAMQRHFFPEEEIDEQEKRLLKRLAWRNAWTRLKVVFGLICFDYLLLPIGIRTVVDKYEHVNIDVLVHARQVHIFGVRVLRRVVKHEWQRKEMFWVTPVKRRSKLRRLRFRQNGRA